MIYVIDHNDSFTHNVVHQLSLFDNVKCTNYDEINTQFLKNASTIVLSPGPGSPKNYPTTSEIYNKFKGKKRILGICLGMQLLADNSEEKGSYQGLGLIQGTVKKINTQKKYRLPHIGWNDLKIVNEKPLLSKILKEDAFYFVHSYEFKANKKYISSFTDYGNDIVSSVQNENIFGVQFHPEKSKTSGLLIFRNFLKFVEKSI